MDNTAQEPAWQHKAMHGWHLLQGDFCSSYWSPWAALQSCSSLFSLTCPNVYHCQLGLHHLAPTRLRVLCIFTCSRGLCHVRPDSRYHSAFPCSLQHANVIHMRMCLPCQYFSSLLDLATYTGKKVSVHPSIGAGRYRASFWISVWAIHTSPVQRHKCRDRTKLECLSTACSFQEGDFVSFSAAPWLISTLPLPGSSRSPVRHSVKHWTNQHRRFMMQAWLTA